MNTTPNSCHTPNYNSVWTQTVFDLVLPNQSSLTKWIKAVVTVG